MSKILEARSLSVTAGKARLLSDVSLDIQAGETVVIIGPNGAGKSTLLRALSADIATSHGDIFIDGRHVKHMRPAELATRRALLSQHVSISFPFTVLEIVRMGATNVSRSVADQLVHLAIEEVGLGAFLHRELPTLSGGEQQRAHFARVLVQAQCGERLSGPGLLMLDEPTSSLDMKHQIALLEIARRRAAAGTAVIAVLHDMNLACMAADRIIILQKGKLVAAGAPQDVITHSMLSDVFEIDVPVNHGNDGRPFILPQQMRSSSLATP